MLCRPAAAACSLRLAAGTEGAAADTLQSLVLSSDTSPPPTTAAHNCPPPTTPLSSSPPPALLNLPPAKPWELEVDIDSLLFQRERGSREQAAPCFGWLGREWDFALPFWPVLFSLHPNKDTRQLAEQITSQSENVGEAAAAAAVTAALIWIFANPVSTQIPHSISDPRAVQIMRQALLMSVPDIVQNS